MHPFPLIAHHGPRLSRAWLAAGSGLVTGCTGIIAEPGIGNAAWAQLQAQNSVAAGAGRWSEQWGLRAVEGVVTIRATRVWTWTDPTTNATRIAADGDVRLTLGTTQLACQRMVLWARAETDQGQPNPARIAVYAVLDDVGSALQAPASIAGSSSTGSAGSVHASRLPVKAVVLTDAVTIDADASLAQPVPLDTVPPALAAVELEGQAALERSFGTADPGPRAQVFSFVPHPAGSQHEVRRYRATLRDGAPPAPTPTPSAPGATAPHARDATSGSASRTLTPGPGPTPLVQQASPGPGAQQRAVGLPASETNAAPGEATAQSQRQPVVVPDATTGTRAGTNANPIFAKSGMITFSAGHLTIVAPGQRWGDADASGAPPVSSEPAIIISGGLTLLYNDAASQRLLQATAQRGVVFLAPGATAAGVEFSASQVQGVYLEGDVSVSDGDLNLRAREVYYDIAANRAVMLDATFWFIEEQRNLPLYIRAREIRQESTRQFEAKDVRFANTAFFEPELSIGVSSATLERRERDLVPAPLEEALNPAGIAIDDIVLQGLGPPRAPSASPLASVGSDSAGAAQPQAGGQTQAGGRELYSFLTARDVTLRVNDVPFFWWPAYSGDPASPLIKDIRFENRSGSGLAGRVRWNATNLLGLSKVEGLSVDVQTDYYVERGAGLGARAAWETRRHIGGLTAYGLLNDEGEDVLKTGTRKVRDGELRGVFALDDRFRVTDLWTVLTEGVFISDETFIDAFYEEAGETRREFTSRVRAERTSGHTQLTLEAKGSFNDFIANEWLLQSQGYSVTKLPELMYVRQADDLLTTAPGLLTYFSEHRVGRVALAFDEIDFDDRGFVTTTQSQDVFGINPNQSISDALRAAGLNEDGVTRLDTRHEVIATFESGPVRVAPFAVARATMYDTDFDGFSSRPGGNDEVRVWTSLGARASTSIERIHDGVDSRFLDLHRLRHIVEPSLTLWTASTNVEAGDLPIFDSDVEGLSDGAALRLGLAQTLQTKRGGPGRWYDSNVLVMNTDVVLSSSDADPRTPIGRFFDSRPERSALGDYFVGDVAYRLTDATSLTASTIYDLKANQQDLSTAGILLQHEPGFSTLVDMRFLNPQDSTILAIVGSYELSDKYSVIVSPNYSLSEGGVQSIFARINRRFSSLQAGLSITYNNISGETSFGFVLQPYGARGAAGAEGLGSELPAAYGSGGGGGL